MNDLTAKCGRCGQIKVCAWLFYGNFKPMCSACHDNEIAIKGARLTRMFKRRTA